MLRRLFAATVILLQTMSLSAPIFAQQPRETSQPAAETAPKSVAVDPDDDYDADLPKLAKQAMGKEKYRQLRDEQIALLRGLPYPKEDVRSQAIFETMRQENRLRAATGQSDGDPNALWRAIGPNPIPNGQTVGRTDPVSGRVSSLAVHPTNPNIVYVGTAQGGLYRTLDGGANWTPLLDNALTLAIGSVAIAPSDPSIVFVGTGEPAFSQDAFFGVGIYRITNADSQNPVVSAPLNRDAAGNDLFTGRSVSEIVVHPTDPNIIFASTANGVGGLGGNAPAVAANRGLFRTTNALAASPTFQRLTVNATNPNLATIDIIMEPGNPNRLIVGIVDTFPGGTTSGAYLTTNALDAAPTFTRTLTTGNGANEGRIEFAINKVGSTVTVIAAAGLNAGTVHRSTDGGATWTQTVDNNFCSPQCFYDIAVAMDPADANKIYLGGSPALPFGRSTNGGTSFVSSSTGLHVDSHAIAVAPSSPNTIYFGSDGGVWKSVDGGTNWTSLNNSGLNSIQFQSIALHPTDRNYTLGGTQDNGTNYYSPNQAWLNSDFGDGGFVQIDSNSTSPTSLTAYHTYFNSTNSLIGFTRANTTQSDGDPNWGAFLGCQNGITNNGILCADPVLFYAPLVLGPGSPLNTVYFGTNKVYRSDNFGTLMLPVSQALPSPISAIAISPQNDNVRVAGTSVGDLFGTVSGAATMNNLDPNNQVPARYVGRIAIDPTNQNTAYVALGGFGLADGQHIYKTTNLNAATPNWTVAGSGIPDVPVNALAIDPQNTNNVYAGTDIGVFRSVDAGASWLPFNDGMPRVAVFDMAIQNQFRVLRVATHGRGMYEASLAASTNRARADFDGDGRTDFSVFRNGEWFFLRSSSNTFTGLNWGSAGDTIIPGDFDGDRKTDFVIYRPSNTASEPDAYILFNDGTARYTGSQWGQPGDVPRVADFDGDTKSDIAVYRPSNNTWYVSPTNGSAPLVTSFAAAGQIPVVLDYDGDTKTDLAMWNQATGDWTIRLAATGEITIQRWGASGDKLVPADYDNDNKDDLAVYRGEGQWLVRQSTNGQLRGVTFGVASDVPAPGDFNGDGSDDFAVFRNGVWYVQTTTGAFSTANFGLANDKPVPAGYIP